MFFKYAFFDLDNTLYNYTECHNKALFFILEGISDKLNISIDEIQDKYDLISRSLKNDSDFSRLSFPTLIGKILRLSKPLFFCKLVISFDK